MKEFFLRQFRALKTTPNHRLRKSVGGLFVVGGLFGFLPVLGYWMIPVGLALLAVDFPLARRAVSQPDCLVGTQHPALLAAGPARQAGVARGAFPKKRT